MRLNRGAVLAVFAVVVLVLLPSCGRRGMPTVKTFEKPQPVQQVKAYHREGEVVITWEYPKDQQRRISGFRVGKSEAGAGIAGEAAVLPNDASAFADKDFEPGKRYTYFVLPVNLRGIPADEPVSLSVSPRRTPPPPAGLSVSPREDSLELRWEPVAMALQTVRYNVYRSARKGEYGPAPINPKPLDEALFVDRIQGSTTTYYVVRSLLNTEIGDEGRPSAELTVNPGTFVPSPPSGLQVITSPDDVVLIWQGSPEVWVSGYGIYRHREGEKEFTRAGGSLTPTFRDPGAVTVKTRYYVTAEGPGRQSRPSQTVETIPLEER